MKEKITLNDLLGDYEMCGVGAAPEVDGLVVMSDEAIRKLRGKPGLFERLFSGPFVLSGTGADSRESGFMIQELVERGIRN